MTPDVLTVSPAPCRLVGGAFAVLVQVLLCVVLSWRSSSSGWETARYEALSRRGSRRGSRLPGGGRPGRSFREWSFDVSKQGFSAVVSHAFNVFLAVVLAHTKIKMRAGPAVHPDQCAWYLINYIADCFVGILLIFLLLRLLEWTSATTRLATLASGILCARRNRPRARLGAAVRCLCPHHAR